MSENSIPLLPSVPVNFNVMHDAILAGEDPVIAAAKGIAAENDAIEVVVESLKGKRRDELVKIALKEGAIIKDDDTIPDITTAIESKRAEALKEETGIADPITTPEPSSDGAAE